jgi:hypothetical protein
MIPMGGSADSVAMIPPGGSAADFISGKPAAGPIGKISSGGAFVIPSGGSAADLHIERLSGGVGAQPAMIPPGGSVAMIPLGVLPAREGAIPPGGLPAGVGAIPAGGALVPPRLMDECGQLPCTGAGLGVCSHLLGDPLVEACRAALTKECWGLEEKVRALKGGSE